MGFDSRVHTESNLIFKDLQTPQQRFELLLLAEAAQTHLNSSEWSEQQYIWTVKILLSWWNINMLHHHHQVFNDVFVVIFNATLQICLQHPPLLPVHLTTCTLQRVTWLQRGQCCPPLDGFCIDSFIPSFPLPSLWIGLTGGGANAPTWDYK